MGYQKLDNNFWPFNIVILVAKKYIYWCSCKEIKLDIYFFQREFLKIFIEQKNLSQVNLKENVFNRKWNQLNVLAECV